MTHPTPTSSWVPLNDLSRGLAAGRAELVDLMGQVADSGWLVQGPQHGAFETELAAFLGVEHVLGVASGTDALELALRAVIPADRPVVVTAANCGGYTSTAARRAGLEVRFADVDQVTHLVTAETLAPVLDEHVGAVVVTHLYGRSADVAAVHALCAPLGIKVVEDCAQALGARTGAGRVGSQTSRPSASTRRRTSVRSATAVRSRRRLLRLPTSSASCASTGGAASTRSRVTADATHASTSSRQPCCASACRTSTAGTRVDGRSSRRTPSARQTA